MAWKSNWKKFSAGGEGAGDGQSVVDGAFLKVIRMHDSWSKARWAWRNGDPDEVNAELELVWFELAADAKKEETERFVEICNRITKAQTEKDLMKRRKLIFSLLKEKWMHLFVIEKSQGLGKRYRDAKEDELD